MRVLAFVSGEIDSPVMAYLLYSKGFEVDFVHFDAGKYNAHTLRNKTELVFQKFKSRGYAKKLYVVNNEILLDVLKDAVPKKYLVLIWRRFMMRIAEEIAKKEGYDFLATGDNLGQVASQTLHNMHVIDAATSMHVLRPLLTWNKPETIEINKKLGIYEISSSKGRCLLDLPRKAITAAKLSYVEELEKALDVEELKKICLENVYVLG